MASWLTPCYLFACVPVHLCMCLSMHAVRLVVSLLDSSTAAAAQQIHMLAGAHLHVLHEQQPLTAAPRVAGCHPVHLLSGLSTQARHARGCLPCTPVSAGLLAPLAGKAARQPSLFFVMARAVWSTFRSPRCAAGQQQTPASMAGTECMGQGLSGDEAGQDFTQQATCLCAMCLMFLMMQGL